MGGRGSRSRFTANVLGGGVLTPQRQPPRPPQPAPTQNAANDTIPDWKEAFDPGTDYESRGDVDHSARTVSRSLQARWDAFSAPFQTGLSSADDAAMMKDWDWNTGQLYGYFRTTNAMTINKLLFQNPGKTIQQIFGNPSNPNRVGSKDVKTVQTLDRAVRTHKTQNDAYYLRFCNAGNLQRAFGFTDAQMREIANARHMAPAQLAQLNASLNGSQSFSRGYTSTSANRSMNAFKNPRAPQSQQYYYERRLYAPGGTNAYAARRNAQESEVLFGRNMRTKFLGVTYENGHTVIHEMFDGYH